MSRFVLKSAALAVIALPIAACSKEEQAVAPAGPPPIENTYQVVKADGPGRQQFEQKCAPCHGVGPGDDGMPMLPGTMTLHLKYQGQLPGALELRDDLTADAIRLFVRNGSGAMPMFRKVELSDTEIDQIADYLTATAKLSAAKNSE